MKRIFTLFLILTSVMLTAGAQVKVKQSSSIDSLVYAKKPKAATPPTQPTAGSQQTGTQQGAQPGSSQAGTDAQALTDGTATAGGVQSAAASRPQGAAARPVQRPAASSTSRTNEDAGNTSILPIEEGKVDYSRKVIRNGVKVDGYRIQVYSGGSTRADRLKAEEIGHQVKEKCPEQPVYVHYYSPRWICRVGNFVNIKDAQELQTRLRNYGFKNVAIVKGRITVKKSVARYWGN